MEDGATQIAANVSGNAGMPSRHMPFSRLVFAGAPLWGLAMVASLLLWQWHTTRLLTFHLQSLAILFFAGGALGWMTSLPIARFLSRNRREENRLAALFLGLTTGTAGFTALLFALLYCAF